MAERVFPGPLADRTMHASVNAQRPGQSAVGWQAAAACRSAPAGSRPWPAAPGPDRAKLDEASADSTSHDGACVRPAVSPCTAPAAKRLCSSAASAARPPPALVPAAAPGMHASAYPAQSFLTPSWHPAPATPQAWHQQQQQQPLQHHGPAANPASNALPPTTAAVASASGVATGSIAHGQPWSGAVVKRPQAPHRAPAAYWGQPQQPWPQPQPPHHTGWPGRYQQPWQQQEQQPWQQQEQQPWQQQEQQPWQQQRQQQHSSAAPVGAQAWQPPCLAGHGQGGKPARAVQHWQAHAPAHAAPSQPTLAGRPAGAHSDHFAPRCGLELAGAAAQDAAQAAPRCVPGSVAAPGATAGPFATLRVCEGGGAAAGVEHYPPTLTPVEGETEHCSTAAQHEGRGAAATAAPNATTATAAPNATTATAAPNATTATAAPNAADSSGRASTAIPAGAGGTVAAKRRMPASISGASLEKGPCGVHAASAAGGHLQGAPIPLARPKLPSIEELRAAKAAAAAAGAATTPATAYGAPASALPPRLPVLEFKGAVRYADSDIEVDFLCGQLLEARPAVVSVDCEWRPQYTSGQPANATALIQVAYAAGGDPAAVDTDAGRNCRILLLHVRYSGITPHLRTLLESTTPQKVGVNITGDAQKLLRDFGVEMRGLVELDGVANERVLQHVKHISTNTEFRSRWSLSALVEATLRRHLPKPQAVRCGNWERRPLTDEQKRYAALDAHAGLAVWAAIMRLPLRPRLPREAAGGGMVTASPLQQQGAPDAAGEAAVAPATAAADEQEEQGEVTCVSTASGAPCTRSGGPVPPPAARAAGAARAAADSAAAGSEPEHAQAGS